MWLAMAGVLWLFATPYIGIDHDARLYVLMAMRWLSPEHYARDPWFVVGSQDDWSVFSPLLAQTLAVLGMERGAMAATLLGGLLFVLAAALLARSLLRGSRAWLALLLLVSLPLCYSFNGMLDLREGFVTARAFAVPLSLLGLALALRKRPGFSLVGHLAALLLHPLMAVGPAAVSFLLSLPARWRPGWALAGITLVVAGFAALPVVDDVWYELVRMTPLVFIDDWLPGKVSSVLAWIALLLLASRLGSRVARPAYAMCALVALLGIAASIVAAKHFPVLVYLQGQPWRAIWLAQVLGVIAAVDLAARYILRSRAACRPQALLLTVLGVHLAPYLGWLLLGLYALVAGGQSRRLRRIAQMGNRYRPWLWGTAALLLAMLLPEYLYQLQFAYRGVESHGVVGDALLGLLRVGGYGALPLALWLVAARHPRGMAIPLLLLPAAALAAALWDDRPAARRYQEARYVAGGSGSLFQGRIRPGDVVYWHSAPERVWFELGTAGYASNTHSTGQIYSRQRTELLEMRMIRLAMRGLDEATVRAGQAQGDLLHRALTDGRGQYVIKPFVLASYEMPFQNATEFGIRFLCQDRALDYVVDSLKINGRFAASEEDRLSGKAVSQYLYRCADLRGGGGEHRGPT